MKKIICLVLGLMLVSSFAFAQEEAATVTIKGTIIDNMCAGNQKPEQLAEFVKTHTKQCALMEPCVASGYSILADGKLTKFDKDSSAKIAEFLKKEDSKLQVVIEAKMAQEELSLVSIKNQE